MTFNFEEFKQKVHRKMGIKIEESDFDYERITMNTAKRLLDPLIPHAARKMGITSNRMRERLINFQIDEHLYIEGRARGENNWETFEISVSWGLLMFHYRMASLIVSRMNIVDDNQNVVEETTISTQKTTAIARNLLAAFWRENPVKALKQSDNISIMHLGKGQLELAAYLVHHADCFVISHELGHILINSNPECVKKELMIVEGARESMLIPYLKTIEFDQDKEKDILDNWQNEIAADFIGTRLCLELGHNDITKMATYSSAILSLIMCNMLEMTYNRYTGKNFDYTTHPPCQLRLDFLQTISNWHDDLSDSFRQLSYFILSQI